MFNSLQPFSGQCFASLNITYVFGEHICLQLKNLIISINTQGEYVQQYDIKTLYSKFEFWTVGQTKHAIWKLYLRLWVIMMGFFYNVFWHFIGARIHWLTKKWQIAERRQLLFIAGLWAIRSEYYKPGQTTKCQLWETNWWLLPHWLRPF